MKRCYICGLSKNVDEFHKNSTRKDGLNQKCKTCMSEYGRSHYKANAEKRRAGMAVHYLENKTEYHKKSANWKKAHPEVIKSQMRNWREANLHVVAALASKRRGMRLKATPNWADKKAMKQYYLIANFLSVELTIPFNVDHVVPLQSDLVCGLHAHTNMSIMLGAWNISKGNRWWPDMP